MERDWKGRTWKKDGGTGDVISGRIYTVAGNGTWLCTGDSAMSGPDL